MKPYTSQHTYMRLGYRKGTHSVSESSTKNQLTLPPYAASTPLLIICQPEPLCKMESIQLAQMLADLSDLNAAVCFVDADSLAALRVQAC